MSRVWLVLLVLVGCSPVTRFVPSAELVATGIASERRYELASPVAQSRALAAAAKLTRPRGMTFIYQRERGVARLKLFVPPVSQSGGAKPEPRKPFGARATVAVKRSPEDLATFAKLEAVEETARVQGLDVAVALIRAERDLLKKAIEAFAKRKNRDESTLNGALSLVDYRLSDEGDVVVLRIVVAVEFDVAQRSGSPTATGFDVDREEIEPPSEQIGVAEAASLPASAPASQPASVPTKAPVKGKP